MMLRTLLGTMLVVVLVIPRMTTAVEADEVGFDDTATTTIQGSEVQSALESADTAIVATDAALDTAEAAIVATDAALDTAEAAIVATDAALADAEDAIDALEKQHLGRVRVEEDCDAAGLTLGTDCFEDMTALSNWLWVGVSAEDPTPADPIIVDIGEGTFSGLMACPSYTTQPLGNDSGNPNGWVTLRGVSRSRSRIVSLDLFLTTDDCDGLEFQDLYIEATNVNGFFKGIAFFWRGVGSAIFTDVDIKADYSVWYDYLCGSPSAPVGEHYFYGSKLTSGSLGYYSECGRTWLYGTDVIVRPDSASFVGGLGVSGIQVGGVGDVRLFGSSVRVDSSGYTASGASIYGLKGKTSASSSVIHMHGGIVNVTSTGDHDLIGVDTGAGLIHTLETAFALIPGTGGSATRTSGSGNVQSPLLWHPGDDEPVAGLASLPGQDLFVETDCDVDGDCDAAGDETHLMVSNETVCGSSDPWFNTTTGRCRNDVATPLQDQIDDLDARVTALEGP